MWPTVNHSMYIPLIVSTIVSLMINCKVPVRAQTAYTHTKDQCCEMMKSSFTKRNKAQSNILLNYAINIMMKSSFTKRNKAQSNILLNYVIKYCCENYLDIFRQCVYNVFRNSIEKLRHYNVCK